MSPETLDLLHAAEAIRAEARAIRLELEALRELRAGHLLQLRTRRLELRQARSQAAWARVGGPSGGVAASSMA